MSRRPMREEAGAIPFVLIGVLAAAGTLGVAWSGQQWARNLLNEAGGSLTVWVLHGAFWVLDVIGLQAATEPVNEDWYTPVLEGPALPIWALAALVMLATLIIEVVCGVAQGNTTRIVQAVFRALMAAMLATVGAGLLLAIGGALSDIGRLALEASGTSMDAPLVPLAEVLMDTAEQKADSPELFIAFLAGMVIIFTGLSIYFLLAMRPVLLAAIIVFLPVAHAMSIWEPMRRAQMRVWSLAFAVLLADAAILTMFAVANTVVDQPHGVDRLIFGTFGLLLAALAPAAMARIVGAPELHTAVQSMARGSKMLALGAGAMAYKGARSSMQVAGAGAGAAWSGSALEQRAGGGLDGGGFDGGGAPGGGGDEGGTGGAGTGGGASGGGAPVPTAAGVAPGGNAGAATTAGGPANAGSAASGTGSSTAASSGSRAGDDVHASSAGPGVSAGRFSATTDRGAAPPSNSRDGAAEVGGRRATTGGATSLSTATAGLVPTERGDGGYGAPRAGGPSAGPPVRPASDAGPAPSGAGPGGAVPGRWESALTRTGSGPSHV